jgi:ABC-2 type transport system ATP-binding protein
MMPQPPQLTAVRTGPPTGTGNATIEVNGLGKTYPGGVEAVRAIDFSVCRGEVFGLLGPNGAGKSTTVGMLTTTILPTAGTATVVGFDVVRAPLQARRAASVVFQEPVVDRPLSGRRNLELHGALWGLPRSHTRERVQRLARSLGLSELLDRPVGSYSGGQRRRLEIARALVSEPSVLFLDEPTVGLDPLIRRELLDVIARLRDETEMTILLTTHYLEEAERLCDRVAIMHAGEIVALDTPSALLGRLGAEIVELRVAGDGDAALGALRAERIAGADAFAVGSTITVPLDGITVTEALAGIDRLGLPVTAVSTRAPTLDDVYVRMTDTRLREAA